MNSIVCFETIAAFVFGFCFICAESNDDSTLTRGPNDASVVLGGTVTLECFTGDMNYPPAWTYLKAGSGEKKDISLVFKDGDRIVPKLVNGYVVRHRIVEDRSTGEYSLRITDAKSEDAGIYTCTARGGLREKRSAELSVFEPFPVCAPNITDVVGENDCHKEPDVIEFSCKFRIYGNYLPTITWTVANHPEKVMKIDTPTMNATGMASSKLIIKGNHVGLDMTSFKCIISSTEEADDNRSTCVTPKINVRKISNLTESKTLKAPEEVECTLCKGWSKLNASGSDWFRRDVDDNGRQQETHVTSKSLLNLYRSEMKPGTYICVANCNIRGELCRVKLLYVSYQPPASEPVPSRTVIVASVLSTLVLTIAAVATVIFIWRWRSKNRHSTGKPKTDLPVSSDSSLQNQQGAPLLNGNRSSTDTPLEESDSGKGDSRTPSQQNTPPISQETLLTGSDGNTEPSIPSQQSNPSSQEPPNGDSVSVDIPDAKLGGIKNTDRARLAEEKALARMRANAARKDEEKIPLISPDDDVAEGVAADKKKHE